MGGAANGKSPFDTDDDARVRWNVRSDDPPADRMTTDPTRTTLLFAFRV